MRACSEASPERATSQNGDDYVLGLLQGARVRYAVSTLLQEGAEYVTSADASGFEKVVTGHDLRGCLTCAGKCYLPGVLPRALESRSHSRRTAISRAYGPAILQGADPLLHRTLLAVVEALAQPGDHTFLSRAVFIDVVGNVIGGIAAQPSLLDNTQWLQTVLSSVATIVREQEHSGLLSQTSLEAGAAW